MKEEATWPAYGNLSLASRQEALEKGPYGRGVYHCDNDVVDHQTVNMEFEGGASVVLIMHGHSHEESRTMRYDGSRATRLRTSGVMIQSHLQDLKPLNRHRLSLCLVNLI